MYDYKRIRKFTFAVLKKMGCSDSDAEQATDVLLSADLRGVDSHGVARLSGYVRLWEAKRVNTTPDIKIIHETPSTATIDGDAGLGLVIAPFAMNVAIEKARQVGTGWVTVKNSNHYGIAGYHSMMALKNDMIGISLTNASPLVSPTFSKERLLGTNPISVAIPAGNQPPMIVDMATTTVANGKLEIQNRKGEKLPPGWAQDKQGNSSTDPLAIKEGGALLPLGGTRTNGSHKGYALGATVDILSAVLSGASYGPWVPPFVSFIDPLENQPGEGLGHFFGAMRVDAFRPIEDFKSHMDNWISTFRNSKSTENKKVLIPGDPEREMEKERKKNGIPLLEAVVNDLETLGNKFGIEL